MHRKHVVVAVAAAALAATGCASNAGSADEPASGVDSTTSEDTAGQEDGAGQEISDGLEALIDGAGEEDGTLLLNWGSGSIPDNLDTWVAAFNDTYGLDIEVSLDPVSSFPNNFATVVEEYDADRPASTDVFLGSTGYHIEGGPEGHDVFEVVDWASISPDWPEGMSPDGSGSVVFLHQIPGFAYNVNEVDEADLPETVADVVEFAAANPVATTPYAGTFQDLAAPELLGEDGLLAHAEAFGEVSAGAIGCSDVDRIATGEFLGFWINCGNNIVESAKANRGAPIDSVVIKDAALTKPWMIAVPKNAQHPNTAKLWVHWLNTPEAQQLVYESEYADNILRDESRTAAQVAELEADGADFLHLDYDYALANPVVTDPEIGGQLPGLVTGQ